MPDDQETTGDESVSHEQLLDAIRETVGDESQPAAQKDQQSDSGNSSAADGRNLDASYFTDKQDAQAFLDQSRDRLEKWMQLLADKQIDEDEFRWLVESQKAAAQMEALRKANAGTMQIEKFRDSALQIVVKVAITAAIPAI